MFGAREELGVFFLPDTQPGVWECGSSFFLVRRAAVGERWVPDLLRIVLEYAQQPYKVARLVGPLPKNGNGYIIRRRLSSRHVCRNPYPTPRPDFFVPCLCRIHEVERVQVRSQGQFSWLSNRMCLMSWNRQPYLSPLPYQPVFEKLKAHVRIFTGWNHNSAVIMQCFHDMSAPRHKGWRLPDSWSRRPGPRRYLDVNFDYRDVRTELTTKPPWQFLVLNFHVYPSKAIQLDLATILTSWVFGFDVSCWKLPVHPHTLFHYLEIPIPRRPRPPYKEVPSVPKICMRGEPDFGRYSPEDLARLPAKVHGRLSCRALEWVGRLAERDRGPLLERLHN